MDFRRFISPLRIISFSVLISPIFIKNLYWLNLVSLVEIYILVGLGYNILLGYAGQASLGHGAVYGIGA